MLVFNFNLLLFIYLFILNVNNLQFFGVVPKASLLEMEAAGRHYCEGDWGKLKDEYHGIDQMDLLRYCFSSAFIVAFLHDGLGISMDDKRYALFSCAA